MNSYTIHYILYTIYYILYTTYYILYTIHYALYIIHYALYIIHHTLILRFVSIGEVTQAEKCIRKERVNVHIKNSFDRDAMQIAARNGCIPMLSMLMSYGGTPLTVDYVPSQTHILPIFLSNTTSIMSFIRPKFTVLLIFLSQIIHPHRFYYV